MDIKKNNKKARSWVFLVYPESAPSDWKQILEDTMLPVAISPLHNNDYDEGKKKKEHYHVMITYDGPTTFNNVCNLTNSLNSPIPVQVMSVKGQYQYFTHRNNPEKAQYKESDIMLLNGFTLPLMEGINATEKVAIKKELISIIMDNEIKEYSSFIEFILHNGDDIKFEVASTNTMFFDRFLSSKRHKEKENNKKKSKENISVTDDTFAEIKLNELREERNEFIKNGEEDTIEFKLLVSKIKHIEDSQESGKNDTD